MLPPHALLGAALLVPFTTTATPPQPLAGPSVAGPALAQAVIHGPMSYSQLTPAHVTPGLCVYHYRVTTNSPECQRLVDQGLGYYYSYVYLEASRAFETALRHDPDCAFAYWGLSKALERRHKPNHVAALERARDLLPRAGHRERLLITARLHEKGLMPGVKAEDRKKKARETLDELLTLHDDDEEGWFCRAQLCDGAEAVPYYKALLRINPLHPGANHELVHFYEGYGRPALGWPYAEGYIASSPGIPHAFHMQSHLAMRIGKWEQTTDRSARAVELEKAYHRDAGVKPTEDDQFLHHVQTLTTSLVHDGRFAEARQVQKEARALGYRFNQPWFRMDVAAHDWDAAEKIVAETRKGDKPLAAYLAAVLYLERGDAARAAAEVDVLRQALQTRKTNRRLEQHLWEVQGRLFCQTGSGEAGLKLLRRVVDETKDDYGHHAWAGGGYYMEAWGCGALECGDAAAAEEAFQEALAHDAGSVRGALGMQALCERLGRAEEARRYGAVARRCWARADPKDFAELRGDMARRASHVPTPSAAEAVSSKSPDTKATP